MYGSLPTLQNRMHGKVILVLSEKSKVVSPDCGDFYLSVSLTLTEKLQVFFVFSMGFEGA